MKREENQTVEYKESWHEKYLEWICGYANARGGTLYIGIEDGSKSPVGVAKAHKLSEDIPNMIRDTMGLVADVAILKKSGKDVIRIKVKPSAFPVSYHGCYFYRTGSVKMQLTGSALTQFILEKTGREWDTSVANGEVRLSDYTFIALNNRYRLVKGVKLTKSDFISFGLANESGALTNTGALLADESPIAHSRVFCTRWNGLDMTAGTMDAADDQEYGGGLLQLLKYAEDFVRLHTRRSWHKRPEDRVDFYEYPARSITEMIINGLVHRDYLAYGSEVHIDIFDDRIEITSPGGMPGDRRVQDYPNPMSIPSYRRNRTLADVFERLEFMERKGSGFKKLFEDYDRLSVNLGHRRPSLESEDVYFRVTLPNLLYGFSDEQLVAATDSTAHEAKLETHHDTLHETHHDALHDERVVNDRMLRVLKALGRKPLGMSELRATLRIRDRATVRESYLRPCFQALLVELTLPGAKRSRLQKYRLTEKGRKLLAANTTGVRLQDNDKRLQDTVAMPNNGTAMPNNSADMPNNAPSMPTSDETGPDKQLWEIVQGLKHRAGAGEIEDVVCKLCAVCPIRRDQIAHYVDRSDKYVRLLLNRLVKAHRIRMTIPEMPKHPAQAYVANEEV